MAFNTEMTHETYELQERDMESLTREEYSYLKEVDSLALANTQIALQQAYANFFRRVSKGQTAGFPKFKSKRTSRKSYSTNNQKCSVRIEDGKIKLPKVGFVKIVQHRPIMIPFAKLLLQMNFSSRFSLSSSF